MTDTSSHLSWETVNDYADARLDREARRAAAAHLEQCAECRDTLAELRCLLAAASDVPEAIVPPAPLWGEIRSTIVARQQPIAESVGSALSAGAPYGWSNRWLAAAAFALVVVSSGATVLVMRSSTTRDGEEGRVAATRAAQPASGTQSLPASFVRSEDEYLSSAASLQRAFDAQRNTLSPKTIAVVERSLATIDAAIAEARRALMADPANDELQRLLDSNYRKKVDLLRRAAELGAST